MFSGNVIVLSEFMVSRTLNDISYDSNKKENERSKNMNAIGIFSIILHDHDSKNNFEISYYYL